MLKRRLWLGVTFLVILGCTFGAAKALGGGSPWTRTDAPTLDKVVDLPDNQLPVSANDDCTPITTKFHGSSTMQNACVHQTPYGLAGSSGTVFLGSSEMIPIVPPFPFLGLNPVPGQATYYTYVSAPVTGMYLFFYKSIWDKVDWKLVHANGQWQYNLKGDPEISIKDPKGNLMPVNPGSLAISQNGSWLIADFPSMGFVRINMATFDMLPFAPSMGRVGDYSSHDSQLSITNDGRYAVIQPKGEPVLKVYDLHDCAGASLPVKPQTACASRDYWPALTAKLPGLRGIYHPRFVGDTGLSFKAVYDYTALGHFKAASYVLTAPGEEPFGIAYLGMGDSYASGQGAFSYIDGTDTANDTCHLSAQSYPELLSAQLFSGGHSVACSGAKMEDVSGDSQTYNGQNTPHRVESQLENLGDIFANFAPGYILQNEFVQTYNPRTITLSIGGNDIGFAGIVKTCVMPKLKHNTCYESYEDQQELANSITAKKDDLRNLYQTLAAPGRQVYVIGYPQIVVSGGNCADNVHLNDKEIKLFVSLTDVLNQTIQTAAAEAGVHYVDVSDALRGHRMCETASDQVAVNGLTAGNDSGVGFVKFIGAESYHPNVLGHELLLRAILGKTNNFHDSSSVAQPPAAGTPGLPYDGAPQTGRSLRTMVNDADLAPDIAASGAAVPVATDHLTAILQPGSTYAISLDDGPEPVASGAVTTQGTVATNLQLPAGTPCGLHTLHVIAPNMAAEPIDIYKTVYVSGCGSDGQPDAAGPCGIIPAAGTDSDNDGIDDACDPFIGAPSALYKTYLLGSTIHVQR